MATATLIRRAARHAATAVARRRVDPARPSRSRAWSIEPSEARTLLSAVTLTGTAGNDAFLATLDPAGTAVRFYLNAMPDNGGTPVQTVPVADLTALTIDGAGGADGLTLNLPGVTLPASATGQTSLALTVTAGTVRLAAPVAALTTAAAGTAQFTAPVTLAGPVQVAGAIRFAPGGTTTLSGPVAAVGPAATLDIPAAATLSVPAGVTTFADTTLTLPGGGTLALPAWTIPNGTVRQLAGTVAVTGGLTVGNQWGNARYELAGGSLAVAGLYVGPFATGVFAQTGGTLASTHTEIGTYAYGRFEQSAGTAELGEVVVGNYYGYGALALSGTATTTAGVFRVGFLGATGTVTIADAAHLTARDGERLALDPGAHATVVQTGGTNDCPSNLEVGLNGGQAAYTLAGGTLNASWELVAVNYFNDAARGPTTGTFTQTGGHNHAGGNGLWIGLYAGAVGSYDLSGGTLAADAYLLTGVANQTPAAFTQSGGSATAGTAIFGHAGPATATLTGGSLAVAANAYVGLLPGGDSTLALAAAADLAVGGALYVSGDGVDGNPAGHGTVTLADAARLTTDQTYVGYSAPATFRQAGGTHATHALVLNGPAAPYADYAVTGGTVQAAATIDVRQPAATGAAAVDEGTPYTLHLAATTDVGHNAITSWAVNWGDRPYATGYPGTTTSAGHTYATGGTTRTVNATATGGGRQYPSAPVTVLVNDVPAAVPAQPARTVDVGRPLTISIPFADPSPTQTHTATIAWGDGTTSPATLTEQGGTGTLTATHTYRRSGPTTALLLLADSAGAVATVPLPVTVAYLPPTVYLTAPAGPTAAGQPVTLTLHDDGPESADAIAVWGVDWGDGTVEHVTAAPDADGTWTVTHAYPAGGTFDVHATASDAHGGHDAGWANITIAQPPVTDLAATAINDNTVALTWAPATVTNDVAQTDGPVYEVSRRTGPDGEWFVLAILDAATTHDLTDPTAVGATTYTYGVRLLDTANASPGSTGAAYVTLTTPLTTPSTPTNVNAVQFVAGRVDLFWQRSESVVTAYQLTATPVGGGPAVTEAAPSNAVGHAFDGLTPGTDYAFTVTAVNDQGGGHVTRSSPSSLLTATVPAATLSAAVPLTVQEGAPVTLTLSADAPAAGGSPITGWRVAWNDGTVRTYAAYSPGTVLTDTFAFLADAVAGAADVTAIDAAGHTFTLPKVGCDVVPTAPANLTADVPSTDAVKLTWGPPSPATRGYTVRRTAGGASEVLADLPATATGFTDPNVEPSTNYAYEVESTGGLYVLTHSAPQGAELTTPAPGEVTLAEPLVTDGENGACTGVTLNWTYSGPDVVLFEIEVNQLTGRYPATNFYFKATAPGGRFGSYNYTGELGETFQGQQFAFRVRAIRTDGTASDYATSSPVTAEAARPTITAADAPDQKVGTKLSFTYPAQVSQYEFQFRPHGALLWWSSGAIPAVPSGGVTTYVTPGVPGIAYDYRVHIVLPWDDGVFSKTITYTMPVGRPRSIYSEDPWYHNGMPVSNLHPDVSVDETIPKPGYVRVTWKTTGSISYPAGDDSTPDKVIVIPDQYILFTVDIDSQSDTDPIIKTIPLGLDIPVSDTLNPDGTLKPEISFEVPYVPGHRTIYDLLAFNDAQIDDGKATSAGRWGVVEKMFVRGEYPGSAAAPTELTATLITDHTAYRYPKYIDLHWKNTADKETSFVVERSTSSDFSTDLKTVASNLGPDTTKFKDEKLELERFYYRVKAVRNGVDSAWSNTAYILVHYKITLNFNAFIPKNWGKSGNLQRGVNWGKDPGPVNLKIPENLLNYYTYYGTDDRSFAGQLGTSRIHTEVQIDTSQIGMAYVNVAPKAGCDPTHQVDGFDRTDAMLANYGVGGLNVGQGLTIVPKTEVVTTASLDVDHALYVAIGNNISLIRYTAVATHPFSPWLVSPGIHIDATWVLKKGTGITTQVGVTAQTTHFPAFEGLANGKVIVSDYPYGYSGPSVWNLGPQGNTHTVTGIGGVP